MLCPVNGAAGTVLIAAQVAALGAANMAVGFCHAFIMAYIPFIGTQISCFVLCKLAAANALPDAALLVTLPG